MGFMEHGCWHQGAKNGHNATHSEGIEGLWEPENTWPILTKESRHMSKLMFLDVSGLLYWNILQLWIAIWNKLSLLARKLARNRCVVLRPFEGARSLTAPCRVPLTGDNEIKGFPITRNIKSLNSNRCQTIHTSFSGECEQIAGSAALSSSINCTFTEKTSQYFTPSTETTGWCHGHGSKLLRTQIFPHCTHHRKPCELLTIRKLDGTGYPRFPVHE
jgi:hypothetical protein